MKQEGFITPLTMVISFILLSAVMHQIQVLEQEREFLEEEKQVFLMEQLLQIGTTDMLGIISSTELDRGEFDYEHGSVTYQVIEATDEEIIVKLQAVTKHGRKNQAILFYNVKNKQLSEWREL
jgi:hypothetical protein